jgi:hypothetical protein
VGLDTVILNKSKAQLLGLTSHSSRVSASASHLFFILKIKIARVAGGPLVIRKTIFIAMPTQRNWQIKGAVDSFAVVVAW